MFSSSLCGEIFEQGIFIAFKYKIKSTNAEKYSNSNLNLNFEKYLNIYPQYTKIAMNKMLFFSSFRKMIPMF